MKYRYVCAKYMSKYLIIDYFMLKLIILYWTIFYIIMYNIKKFKFDILDINIIYSHMFPDKYKCWKIEMSIEIYFVIIINFFFTVKSYYQILLM